MLDLLLRLLLSRVQKSRHATPRVHVLVFLVGVALFAYFLRLAYTEYYGPMIKMVNNPNP